MLGVTEQQILAYFYIRRNNRVPKEYYTVNFRPIERYFSNREFNQKTVDDYLLYTQALFQQKHKYPMSASTYNKILLLLKVIGKLLKVGFMQDYATKPPNNKETEKLTIEECKRLLEVDLPYRNDVEYRNFRWKLIFKVFLITTARFGEIASLTWKDMQRDSFIFDKTKNGTSHRVFLPHHVAEDVRKLRHSPLHNYIFGHTGQLNKQHFNNELAERCMYAGITKHITSRSLRVSGITAYLKKFPIHRVAKISNHKSIDVLYNHYYKSDQEEIEEMVENNMIDGKKLQSSDVLSAYQKINKTLKGTEFAPLALEVERVVVQQLSSL